jgi:cytoplasmic iron level regulating protein YaaA (DUF328/UPF0246 family)
VLTLLSPAKSLDFTTPYEGLAVTRPQLEEDTEVLIDRCKALDAGALRKLMKLSEKLGELNYQRFQDMTLPLTPENAKPCVLAFQGDVYKGLDAGSLSKQDQEWAQGRLRILSGLYGVLRPLDLIQPYRLEMGTRLDNERGPDLYAFWGDRLADALNAEEEKRPVQAVLNLASNEYFKAVAVDRLRPRLLTAEFRELRDGEPKMISFYAKRARGLLARFVIDQRIDDPEGLKDFRAEGYSYRPEMSDPDRLLFLRDQDWKTG